MSTTTLPVVEGSRPPAATQGAHREGAIRAGVLAALGRPDQPFRMVVVPLWGDHFRVNVVTGDDPVPSGSPTATSWRPTGAGISSGPPPASSGRTR